MILRSASATHVGLRRDNNEDSLLDTPGLYAVADGLGGHSAGEVASRIAIDVMRHSGFVTTEVLANERLTRTLNAIPLDERFRKAFQCAHQHILADTAEHPERSRMGTTLTALHISKDPVYNVAPKPPGEMPPQLRHRAVIAHVGDSRCYLVRRGESRQLTQDHSINGGRVLTNCLGNRLESHTQTDVVELVVEPGDVFVLCTDGLGDYADAANVAGIVSACRDIDPRTVSQRATTFLVEYALRQGGRDNVTVVVVAVLP